MKTTLISLALVLTVGTAACSSETPAPQQAAKPVTPTLQTAQVQTVSTKSRGEKLYKRCVTCHTLEDGGKHKVGPNLHGIYGMTAGTKEGYAYSKAMKESGVVWTDETIDGYIENPSKYMPKNKMSYAGLRKPEDRKALLEFLKKATE